MGHLSTNYRSAQVITKLTSTVLEAIKETYGSHERETHTFVRLNPNAPEGQFTFTQDLASQQAFVEQSPNAIVLTPDEGNYPLWPTGQCTSLASFQGLSETHVLLYGFSAYYREALDTLQAFFSQHPLPSWQENLPFARRFKNENPVLPSAVTRCLQTLYTAFSRSERTLTLCDEHPHPFLRPSSLRSSPRHPSTKRQLPRRHRYPLRLNLNPNNTPSLPPRLV